MRRYSISIRRFFFLREKGIEAVYMIFESDTVETSFDKYTIQIPINFGRYTEKNIFIVSRSGGFWMVYHARPVQRRPIYPR